MLGSHYDFRILNMLAAYDWQVKNLAIKPSFNYRHAVYDDTPYFDGTRSGLINARRTISDLAASLQADWLAGPLRLIAALRVGKFNVPDKTYFSYQGIVNYKIKSNHLLRASYAYAQRGEFVTNLFTKHQTLFSVDNQGINFVEATVNGNPNLDLIEATTWEAGYRWQVSDKFRLDGEVFLSTMENFSFFVNRLTSDPTMPSSLTVLFDRQNIDLKAEQVGATFSAEFSSPRLTLKPFVTWQRTQIFNYSPFTLAQESDPTGTENISIQQDISNYKATPAIYGGLYSNIIFSSRFNLNLNSYFFSSHQISHRVDTSPGYEPSPANIPTKMLLNVKLSYKPITQMNLYFNLRNLLGQRGIEYYHTDRIGSSLLGGITYDF
ncbi:MAG: TonB-dependent receptor [Bacteroidia bacterium]|nr:TonB-dependent receptor [Bacteroidia bacterium]